MKDPLPYIPLIVGLGVMIRGFKLAKPKGHDANFPAFGLAVILACFFCSCAAPDSGRPEKYQPTVELTADMTDEAILLKLGYNRRLLKKTVAVGPDGVSHMYRNRAGDEVIITRSMVTGTSVLEYRWISRSWELGPCLMDR